LSMPARYAEARNEVFPKIDRPGGSYRYEEQPSRGRLTKGEIKYDSDELQNAVRPTSPFWSASEARRRPAPLCAEAFKTTKIMGAGKPKIPRVGMADSREMPQKWHLIALPLNVGRRNLLIVLYFPFRQTTPS
jgi:hypothetical protein